MELGVCVWSQVDRTEERSWPFWAPYYLDAQRAVLFRLHSDGGVRCGFEIHAVNLTARFGAIIYPTVGAVFRYLQIYGAVRRGFQQGKYATVRCGDAVQFNHAASHRTVKKNCTVKSPEKVGYQLLINQCK